MKEHIWYNAEEDQLFIAPFTPTNYLNDSLYFFSIKWWDYCIYINEL